MTNYRLSFPQINEVESDHVAERTRKVGDLTTGGDINL